MKSSLKHLALMKSTEHINKDINIEGARPGVEVPGLAQANLKHLAGKDPVAAALASVVSSLPPSDTAPIPAFEEMAKVANAKVEASRKAARKEKGKEAARGPVFETTWGNDTLPIHYGEYAASASAHSSEWESNWVSGEPTPSKEPECMEREPSPMGVPREPTCVE